MNASEFVTHLSGVKRTREGEWLCKCPAHQDKSPSLTVKQADDGKVLIHCFAGCDPELVAIAAGVQFRDLFPASFLGESKGTARPPIAACAEILAHQATVLLVIAADMHNGKADQKAIYKAIHKIDEVRRALR